MRQWIWRRVVAAAAGVLVAAGAASAQPPGATIPIAPPVEQAPVVAAQPPAVAVPGVPAAGPVVVQGSGGCSNCGSGGTAHRGFVMSGGGGYFTKSCQFGQTCNNGCGSMHSTGKFILGPCSSYFAPCGPGFYGHHHCPGTPVYGVGPRVGFNPCIYDSYLNH
jgi:hypothetical protein